MKRQTARHSSLSLPRKSPILLRSSLPSFAMKKLHTGCAPSARCPFARSALIPLAAELALLNRASTARGARCAARLALAGEHASLHVCLRALGRSSIQRSAPSSALSSEATPSAGAAAALGVSLGARWRMRSAPSSGLCIDTDARGLFPLPPLSGVWSRRMASPQLAGNKIGQGVRNSQRTANLRQQRATCGRGVLYARRQ